MKFDQKAMDEAYTAGANFDLKDATPYQLATELQRRNGVTEEWLGEAFDLKLADDDYDDDRELHEDAQGAIRDAYEIVAKHASLTHVRNFYEAVQPFVSLPTPESAISLARFR